MRKSTIVVMAMIWSAQLGAIIGIAISKLVENGFTIPEPWATVIVLFFGMLGIFTGAAVVIFGGLWIRPESGGEEY